MPVVKITDVCPECQQPAEVLNETTVQGLTTTQYKCGHFVFRMEDVNKPSFKDFVSVDGLRPYKYQIEGAQWAVKNNARVAILDEMGLGKTTQACMVAKAMWRKAGKPKAKDWAVLILCKKTLKYQWLREMMRWNGNRWMGHILKGEHDMMLPNIRVRILSMDMSWRIKDIEAFKKKLNTKLIILDEVQHIKNTDSKRTNGVRKLCEGVDHIIALSGTPIKNNAGEYFPLLNLLAPGKFPTLISFQRNWVDSYWDGYKMKYGGIQDFDRFQEYTSDIIIRRTREEVLPDLPTVQRNNLFSELGDVVEEAYKATVKDFQNYYNHGDKSNRGYFQSNIMAYLAKMRHLTGIAKILPCVDFVEDFLAETTRKLTIFVHHKDVASTLCEKITELGVKPLMLHSGLDDKQRYELIEEFKNTDARVLIASTLASGEGLNIQFCSDCVMMERQWNPANEEQAECRFIRIGQLADKVVATYLTAIGTIDEYLGRLVEKKRSMMGQSLDGKDTQWDESSLMQELAEILAQSGGQQWGF